MLVVVVVVVRGLSMPGSAVDAWERCVGCRHWRVLVREGCHCVFNSLGNSVTDLLSLLPGCASSFGVVRVCSGLFGGLSLKWQSLMTELRLIGSRTASATYDSRPSEVCRSRKRSNHCRGMAAALSMDCSGLFGIFHFSFGKNRAVRKNPLFLY